MGLRFRDLLAAAQGGDEQAFAVLWRDLQPAVLRYHQVVAAKEAAEDWRRTPGVPLLEPCHQPRATAVEPAAILQAGLSTYLTRHEIMTPSSPASSLCLSRDAKAAHDHAPLAPP
jgi:hypothetical protein